MLIFFCFSFIWLFMTCFLEFWLQVWHWGVAAGLGGKDAFSYILKMLLSCFSGHSHSRIDGQSQVAVTRFSCRRNHLLGPKYLQNLQYKGTQGHVFCSVVLVKMCCASLFEKLCIDLLQVSLVFLSLFDEFLIPNFSREQPLCFSCFPSLILNPFQRFYNSDFEFWILSDDWRSMISYSLNFLDLLLVSSFIS